MHERVQRLKIGGDPPEAGPTSIASGSLETSLEGFASTDIRFTGLAGGFRRLALETAARYLTMPAGELLKLPQTTDLEIIPSTDPLSIGNESKTSRKDEYIKVHGLIKTASVNSGATAEDADRKALTLLRASLAARNLRNHFNDSKGPSGELTTDEQRCVDLAIEAVIHIADSVDED